jgi:hypothetical protein
VNLLKTTVLAAITVNAIVDLIISDASWAIDQGRPNPEKTIGSDLLRRPESFVTNDLLLVLLGTTLIRDLVTTSRACTGRDVRSAACESAGPEKKGDASNRAAVADRYALSLT